MLDLWQLTLRNLGNSFPTVWSRVLAVIGLLAFLHWVYFVAAPSWAITRFQRTRPEGLRRYLEWVVATPSLLGPRQKLLVRTALMATYRVEGRHTEAVGYGRANLAALARVRNPARQLTLEAEIRRMLADSLEALGQTEAADEERRRAVECLSRAPADSFRSLARGQMLERANRHAEAYEAYEESLAAIPRSQGAARVECMAHLFLAAHHAGWPAECLRWAEAVIALRPQGQLLRSAHRMAGLACGNLGRLDESEDHTRRAYDLAAAADDRAAMGEILGGLADIQRKRGNLAAAQDTAIQAAALHPKAARMSYAVQSQVLREWGRYDEALAMLRRFVEAGIHHIPALERRVQAACVLDMARIEAESGQADAAWEHIQEAVAELGTDARLGLKCDAAAAWVFAVRGLPDDSRRVAAEAKARLAEFEQDPSTGCGVLFDLGMAAWARGDDEEGIACWTDYLALHPEPVYRPTAFSIRGECHRQLGATAAARADFRQAIALNIDTHHARLAQQRLREMPLA